MFRILTNRMTPNWFADGENIEKLIGGFCFISLQAINVWRTAVNEQRIAAVRRQVGHGDDEILTELSAAKAKLDNVVAIVSADRRKAPPGTLPPTWANRGSGRRATDGPPQT
jgi:hypothetical protein